MDNMNYKTTSEVLTLIKGCSTESDLSETGLTYIMPDSSNEENIDGFVIVKTKESALSIPYSNVSGGYYSEELHVNDIRELTIDDIEVILSENQLRLKFLNNLVSKKNAFIDVDSHKYEIVNIVDEDDLDVLTTILVLKKDNDITKTREIIADIKKEVTELDEWQVSDILERIPFDFIELEVNAVYV